MSFLSNWISIAGYGLTKKYIKFFGTRLLQLWYYHSTIHTLISVHMEKGRVSYRGTLFFS